MPEEFLQDIDHDGIGDSPIEDLLMEELLGIVRFDKEKVIYNVGTEVTKIDVFLPDFDIAIYCDGWEWHSKYPDLNRDRMIDRHLQKIGYRVLRYYGSVLVNNMGLVLNDISWHIQSRRNDKKYAEKENRLYEYVRFTYPELFTKSS